MVDVLAAQGRTDDAQSLRRALWQRQLAAMLHKPAPDEPRVAQAIEQGRALGAQDANFDALWAEAYNASARLRFRPAQEAGDVPAAFAGIDALKRLDGGLWVQRRAGVQSRYLLAATLEASSVPLPVRQLRLRFGSSESGLMLSCVLPEKGVSKGFTVPKGESVELACDGVGEARWQTLLPTLIGAARTGGDAPMLLPEAGDETMAQSERALWKLWDPGFDEQVARWARVAAQARQPGPKTRRWLPSPTRLAPPALLSETYKPAAKASDQLRPQDRWIELKQRFMVSGLALTLFAVGRLAMRDWTLGARNGLTAVMGGFVALPLVATAWGPGKFNGDGWANLAVFASGLALAVAVGMAVIIAMLLHRLHELLDEDGQTWAGTVARGWRQAFWMFGQATRSEFWGFLMFAAWAWGLAIPLGRPWTGIAAAALFVPLWSVTWRRMLSLTRAEITTGLTVLAVLIADLLLRHRT